MLGAKDSTTVTCSTTAQRVYKTANVGQDHYPKTGDTIKGISVSSIQRRILPCLDYSDTLSRLTPIDTFQATEYVAANLRRATASVQFRCRLIAHCLSRRCAFTPKDPKMNKSSPKNINTIPQDNSHSDAVIDVCDAHYSRANVLRLSSTAIARVLFLGMDAPPDIIIRRNKFPCDTLNKLSVTAGGGLGVKSMFVCGQNGVMLRSTDRGKCWRCVTLPRLSDDIDCDSFAVSDDTDVQNIQNCRSKKLMINASESHHLIDKIQIDLLHVSNYSSGSVAVCGRNGYLAVSVDKGCHFTVLPTDILQDTFSTDPSSDSGIKRKWFIDSKKKGLYPYIDIICVEFLSDNEIVFCGANGGIFTSAFHHKYSQVEFEPLIHVVGGTSPENSPCEHISLFVKSREIIVSTPSTLFFCHSYYDTSMNLWSTYAITMVLHHNCGTIRALVEITDKIPKFQESTILSKISEDIKQETDRRNEGNQRKKNPKITYTTSSTEISKQAAERAFTAPRRYFHTFASNGHIVSYDFSALLCISMSPSNDASDKEVIFVTGINFSYTPMVSTVGVLPKMGVGVYTILSSKGDVLILMRSNAAGISVSDDLGVVWSSPSHAFTGKLLILSDTKPSPRPPAVLACASRQSVLLSDVGFYPICDGNVPLFEILPISNNFQIYSIAAFF